MEVLVFSYLMNFGHINIISEDVVPFYVVSIIQDADKEVRKILNVEKRDFSIVFLKSTQDFVLYTHGEWWYGGIVRKDTIYLQSLGLLLKKRIFKKIVLHEIAHIYLREFNLPRFIEEGICIYIAGENCVGYDKRYRPEEIKRMLLSKDKERYLEGLCAAFNYVKELIKNHGLKNIIKERRFE